VPLIDASGSTIGLVNAANVDAGAATTYTYSPSGTPVVSGTTNFWPFLYQGMEQESADAPYYYSGNGQFYSPQLVRSLSEAGQTSSSGPGGPPPTQLAYGPGSQGNGSFGHWYANQVENSLEGGFGGGDIGVGNSEVSYVVPVLAIVQIVEFWDSFFNWLLGGSGAPPTPRKLLHGRHQLYWRILGLRFQIVSENSASPASGGAREAGVQQVQDVVPWAQPFTDLDPFNFEDENQPLPLPHGLEPKKENACREAAKSSRDDWALFCGTLYKRKWGEQLYAKCMSYYNSSAQEKENFCGWLEIPYYNPLEA